VEFRIPLSRPDLDDRDIEAVAAVLRTPYLSMGPVSLAFEKAMADYVGSRHAIAVSSGTSGLHLSVRALGLGPGDEVITTPFSFVASSNCLLFEGVRPVFVDIEPETLGLDPNRLEEAITERTRAVLPVHVFGRPCRIREIADVAARRGLRLIEDACEALGSSVGGRMAGTFGDLGVFAFYPNKQITTGEGGMIVTDRDDLAEACRSMRNQGRSAGGGWLEHERLGYNYRLSELQCALGVSQLAKLEHFMKQRQRVFDLYEKALEGIPGIHLPPRPDPDERVSWFVYVIRLADEFTRQDRDAVLAGLRARRIACRNYFAPIPLQPFMRNRFGYAEGDFPVAEGIASRTVALPFFNRLTERDIAEVADALRSSLEALPRRP